MAYLVVDKNCDEKVFVGKPQRIEHRSIYNKNIVDFVGWSRGGDMFRLPNGSIKKHFGISMKWEDEPHEISIDDYKKLKQLYYK